MRQKVAYLLAALLFLTTQLSFARGGLPDFTELVENNRAAVVNISTRQKVKQSRIPQILNLPEELQGTPWGDLFDRFLGEQGKGDNGGGGAEDRDAQSLGSGFIIDSEGYVLTNNHVVENADSIIVRLSDRRELEAEVIGTDPQTDMAVIKIAADNLPVVKMGDSNKLKVGEWVMAIGSPFGFDHSVSVGVVSALGRSLPSENYVPFIQTDVAINPGNSGGPLFNLDGEVVGINSQIYSRTGGFMGLSFAIPTDVAMSVVRQIKESGSVSRGWLGVLIQDVTRELAESFGMDRPRGALVAQVVADSPASAAGLQVGDIILRFNGHNIERSAELPPLVGQTDVNSDAKITVLRNGKEVKLTITIGKLPQEEQQAKASTKSKESQQGEIARVGLFVQDLTAEQRKELNLEQGVLVQKATAAALDAGLHSGDVITQFNHQPISSSEQLQKLIAELENGSSVPLLIIRNSAPRFLALKIPK